MIGFKSQCVCVLGEAGKRLLAGYFYLVIRKNRFSPDSRQLAMQRSPMLDFESFMLVRANGREEGELSDLGAESRPLWLSQHSGDWAPFPGFPAPGRTTELTSRQLLLPKLPPFIRDIPPGIREATSILRERVHVRALLGLQNAVWKLGIIVSTIPQWHINICSKNTFLTAFPFRGDMK